MELVIKSKVKIELEDGYYSCKHYRTGKPETMSKKIKHFELDGLFIDEHNRIRLGYPCTARIVFRDNPAIEKEFTFEAGLDLQKIANGDMFEDTYEIFVYGLISILSGYNLGSKFDHLTMHGSNHSTCKARYCTTFDVREQKDIPTHSPANRSLSIFQIGKSNMVVWVEAIAEEKQKIDESELEPIHAVHSQQLFEEFAKHI